MAGLYVHIPFCRDACIYCDFHFSISLGHLKPMLRAIVKEIHDQRDFLSGENLRTIYFGGGTPSVVAPEEIVKIIRAVRRDYIVDPQAEVSFEANPDDLNPQYLSSLRKTGINRLSIGIQSFDDVYLKFMNRGHDSAQAKASLKNARSVRSALCRIFHASSSGI